MTFQPKATLNDFVTANKRLTRSEIVRFAKAELGLELDPRRKWKDLLKEVFEKRGALERERAKVMLREVVGPTGVHSPGMAGSTPAPAPIAEPEATPAQQQGTAPLSETANAPAGDAGLFVAVDEAGRIKTSSDGQTWSEPVPTVSTHAQPEAASPAPPAANPEGELPQTVGSPTTSGEPGGGGAPGLYVRCGTEPDSPFEGSLDAKSWRPLEEMPEADELERGRRWKLRVVSIAAQFWRCGIRFTREPQDLDGSVLPYAHRVRLCAERELLCQVIVLEDEG